MFLHNAKTVDTERLTTRELKECINVLRDEIQRLENLTGEEIARHALGQRITPKWGMHD